MGHPVLTAPTVSVVHACPEVPTHPIDPIIAGDHTAPVVTVRLEELIQILPEVWFKVECNNALEQFKSEAIRTI